MSQMQHIVEDITRIFDGFISLCTIPRLWRYCRAFAANKQCDNCEHNNTFNTDHTLGVVTFEEKQC